jgi:hypothetical protein
VPSFRQGDTAATEAIAAQTLRSQSKKSFAL